MNSDLEPTQVQSRPINFSGSLADFEKGQLCFVVARRYRGKGPVKLILHRATATGPASFGYGAFGHYVVSPATLMGMSTSSAKRRASRANGKLGGRPNKKGKSK